MYNWIWFFKNRCLDIWVFSSSACGFMTGGLRNAGLSWFWTPWVHSPPSCRGSRRGSDTTSSWPACLRVRGQSWPFALQYGSLVMGPPRPRGFSQGGGIVWSNGHRLASCTCGLSIMVFRPVPQGLHSRGTTDHLAPCPPRPLEKPPLALLGWLHGAWGRVS